LQAIRGRGDDGGRHGRGTQPNRVPLGWNTAC
jgi:hypothetical protein